MTMQPPSDHAQPGAACPASVVLPSMRWTANRQEVELEQQRLLAWQARLDALVADARADDSGSGWHLLAEAALNQLDLDIDRLFDWLEASASDQPGAIEHD